MVAEKGFDIVSLGAGPHVCKVERVVLNGVAVAGVTVSDSDLQKDGVLRYIATACRHYYIKCNNNELMAVMIMKMIITIVVIIMIIIISIIIIIIVVIIVIKTQKIV